MPGRPRFRGNIPVTYSGGRSAASQPGVPCPCRCPVSHPEGLSRPAERPQGRLRPYSRDCAKGPAYGRSRHRHKRAVGKFSRAAGDGRHGMDWKSPLTHHVSAPDTHCDAPRIRHMRCSTHPGPVRRGPIVILDRNRAQGCGRGLPGGDKTWHRRARDAGALVGTEPILRPSQSGHDGRQPSRTASRGPFGTAGGARARAWPPPTTSLDASVVVSASAVSHHAEPAGGLSSSAQSWAKKLFQNWWTQEWSVGIRQKESLKSTSKVESHRRKGRQNGSKP